MQKTSNSRTGPACSPRSRQFSNISLVLVLLSVSLGLSGCFDGKLLKEWKASEVESWYEEKPQNFDDYMRLARQKVQSGETEKGIQLYKDSISDLDGQFGENGDIRVATAAEELGVLQEKIGRNSDAEVSFRKALDARVKGLPPTHNDVKRSRQKLAGVLRKLFRVDEAKDVLSGTTSVKKESATTSTTAPAKLEPRVRRHKRPAQ
jgi:hypothetical protein